MKRLFTIFMLVLSLITVAQGNLTVTGMVNLGSPSGTPVSNQEITISVFSGGVSQSYVTFTNQFGQYQTSVAIDSAASLAVITTIDCDNSQISYERPITDSLFINQDFVYCENIPTGCEADFDYQLTVPHTVAFINQSVGDNLDYSWSFGDGSYSNEENPMYTYQTGGAYQVCLSIAGNDSSCYDVYCETIVVTNDTLQGCQAAFYYYPLPDSSNPGGISSTFQFQDMSIGNPTSWTWDFGDGSYSNEENPLYTYQTGGAYQVCLSIAGNDSSCYDVYCETIVVTNDTLQGCQAAFYYYPLPDSGNPGGISNTIQFHDMSMGNPISWSWDFGDGNTSTQQNPVYTFAGPGIYDVCLIIQTSDQCTSQYCQPVVVQNDTTPCIAQFIHYPDFSQNDLNLTVQFQDMSYGNITGWFWDFGDGSESTEQDPLHTFPDYGVYHVCLTITGPDCESTWCEDVNVMGTGGECFNYFTYETVDQTVAFSGVHVGGTQATYTWEFGDGTTAEGQEVTHVYDETGMYYVSLVTSDENMCTAVSSNMIVIGDTIQYNQVYGQVFAGDFPIDEGGVMIFSLDSTGNYNPFVEITPIVGDGVFVFPYVPSGSFVLYVFETGNAGYLPTYYGDVINWEEASIIVLGESSNPYDIHLVEAPGVSTGLGGITGLVSNSTLRSTGFLDKINMLLYDSNKQPLGFTHVDESGQFGLYDLALGVYYLYPELSGVAADFMRVELSEDQMQVDLKMTFENGSILGVNDHGESVSAGNVYPNPVGNKLFVPIENSKSQSIEVTIIGMDGRTHYNSRSSYVSGSHVIEIEVDHLPQGLYVVLVSNGAEISSSRKFIK